MAKKEKISEERRKLIKEFIASNELKTAGDVEDALKNLFKDTLQEMLTIKSDDVNGRNRAYEAIVKGDNIPRPGIPESFKVLVRELQSIGLDITVAKKDGVEVDLMTDMDDMRKAAPKRTLSDIDSELLNINFFDTSTTIGEL